MATLESTYLHIAFSGERSVTLNAPIKPWQTNVRIAAPGAVMCNLKQVILQAIQLQSVYTFDSSLDTTCTISALEQRPIKRLCAILPSKLCRENRFFLLVQSILGSLVSINCTTKSTIWILNPPSLAPPLPPGQPGQPGQPVLSASFSESKLVNWNKSSRRIYKWRVIWNNKHWGTSSRMNIDEVRAQYTRHKGPCSNHLPKNSTQRKGRKPKVKTISQ